MRLAKQDTLTPPGHMVSPLVCRGPWMSTVVLYCWCHSDSASVFLYFTFVWKYCIDGCNKLRMQWTDAMKGIDRKLIMGVISYSTDTLIFPIISTSPWKFEYIHPTNTPFNSCTSFRQKREEHWIRQLGTAAPYGCNDHIDNIGNLTSPGCQSVNVINLFDRTSRRHWILGSRRYNKPEIHNVPFDSLLPFVNLQLGLHPPIRTRLYSLPLKTLHVLYETTLT